MKLTVVCTVLNVSVEEFSPIFPGRVGWSTMGSYAKAESRAFDMHLTEIGVTVSP